MISIWSSEFTYEDWYRVLTEDCCLTIGEDFVWAWDHSNGSAIDIIDPQVELMLRIKYADKISDKQLPLPLDPL